MKKLQRWKGLLFVLPSLVGVTLFFILPALRSLIYCFTQGMAHPKFIGLAHFIALFQNEGYQIALKNTLFIIGIALPLLFSASLVIALLIERNIKKYRFIQGFLLIPMALPAASVIFLWKDVFAKEGIINALIGTRIDWLQSDYAPFAIIGIILWKNIGYDVLLMVSSLLTISRDFEEAASLEGAGFWQLAFKVKVPMIVPILFFSLIISLLNCFKIFNEVYLLVGEYPSEKLYMLQHFMNNNFKNLDYELLATAAFILYMGIFAIIYGVTRWQQRYIHLNI